MSRSRGTRSFTAKKRAALVALSACVGLLGALLAPFEPAGANGSQTFVNLFSFVDDSGHHVNCAIDQHIEHPYKSDAHLGFGSTTLRKVSGGLVGDCATFTTFSQYATWTDQDGNFDGSGNAIGRPNVSPVQVKREYAPVKSDTVVTLNSHVHYTHCVTGVPTGNVCDADFMHSK